MILAKVKQMYEYHPYIRKKVRSFFRPFSRISSVSSAPADCFFAGFQSDCKRGEIEFSLNMERKHTTYLVIHMNVLLEETMRVITLIKRLLKFRDRDKSSLE